MSGTFASLAVPADAGGSAAREAPRAKAPSGAALAVAATYRRFDPHLSDAEIHSIARKIDEYRADTAPDRKAKPLRNGDDLVVRFAADERAG